MPPPECRPDGGDRPFVADHISRSYQMHSRRPGQVGSRATLSRATPEAVKRPRSAPAATPMSTRSAQRRTRRPNSRLTGVAATPKRRRHREVHRRGVVFPRGEAGASRRPAPAGGSRGVGPNEGSQILDASTDGSDPADVHEFVTLASWSHVARYIAKDERTNSRYSGSSVTWWTIAAVRATSVCAQQPAWNARG